MPLSNDSAFSNVQGHLTLVNASACVGDCVPDGFWALATTSVCVMLIMLLLLVWAASPRQCCACCGHMGQGFKDMWRGAQQGLLSSPGEHEEGTEMEDWWDLKPQTDRERELVKKQKEAAAAEDDKGKEEKDE